MKPPPLRYVRPATVEEALGLLDGESRALAGGQSLMPLVNLRQLRVTRLVDLEAIAELRDIAPGPGGGLIIGAGVTLSRIESDLLVGERAPLLVDALALVANPQVRARGTIGGNVAHGDSVSEVVTTLVALGATATLRSASGERSAPVEGLRLNDGELIVDLRVPAGRRGAIHEVAPRHAARALAVAAAVVDGGEGVLRSARVAVGGVARAPTLLSGLGALDGVRVDDEDRIGRLLAAGVGQLVPAADPRADEHYRRDVAAELARRALVDAAAGMSAAALGPVALPAPVPPPPLPSPTPERGDAAEIAITVNGRSLRPRVSPRMLLSDLLRGQLGLHATHVGCEHGVCGACNVMFDGVAMRSCLLLAVQAHGREVQTLEGLRETAAVEKAIDSFVNGHGLQCGFCTPGFMITLAELRARGGPVSPEQLAGNLCRCTGYAPIMRVAEGLE
jgi:xanthine dehydrogenase iron-sulfur cluster and FAD-binding subunit A